MPKRTSGGATDRLLMPVEIVERRIYLIRGQRVMLDSDLADLYRVPTKALNQAVRRNNSRFPEEFMFQLTPKEADSLRSQFVTSNEGRGGRRYSPHVFTEHGALSLSFVLKSKSAIEMSIHIIRTFVSLREILATHKDLAHKIEPIERTQKGHGAQIAAIWTAIQKLIKPPRVPTKRIGFLSDENT